MRIFTARRLREVNEWIRGVVVYLEDTTVRSLPVADRVGLKSTDPSVWFGAVQQYVRDLQCPVAGLGEDGRAGSGGEQELVVSAGALMWLLGHAVGLAYDDGVAGSHGYDGIMTKDVLHSGVSHDADISDCRESQAATNDDHFPPTALRLVGDIRVQLYRDALPRPVKLQQLEKCI